MEMRLPRADRIRSRNDKRDSSLCSEWQEGTQNDSKKRAEWQWGDLQRGKLDRLHK